MTATNLPQCDQKNTGRTFGWLRAVLSLQDQELPRDVLIPNIRPILDVLSVGGGGRSGTQPAITTEQSLPQIFGISVAVQASPANTEDMLIGLGIAVHALAPGEFFTVDIFDLSLVRVAAAVAGPVVATWTVLQPF